MTTSSSPDNTLRIVFEKEQSEVSAELLIGSLMHTMEIIHAISREVGPEKKIDIKIKTFEQGSFQVNIELVERAFGWLFSSEGIAYTSGIVTIASGIYALAKHLKGRRPKSVTAEGSQKKIINHFGDTYYVDNRSYHLFNSSENIRKQVREQFQELEKYSDITGFRFEGGGETTRADRDEFSAMGRPIPTCDETPEPQIRVLENVSLLILRPSFDPNLPWDFLYDGRKISARVKDEEILKIINRGESFSKGSRMLVDLEETRSYDITLGEYVIGRDGYHVLRFKEHLPAQRTATLFNEE